MAQTTHPCRDARIAPFYRAEVASRRGKEQAADRNALPASGEYAKKPCLLRTMWAGCLLGAGILLFSAPTIAADLLQVYQQAVQNDPQYAAARASLAAGQEKSAQGLSLLLPQADASGSYTRDKYQRVPHTSETRYTVGLSQPLFNWANYESYEKSKLAVSLAEAQFATAQQDLILRVAKAYFDVLSATDVLGFAVAQKTAIFQQRELARTSFEVGTTTITDVHESQARYDLASAQEYAAASDLEVKRSALGQIIGVLPASLTPLKKAVDVTPPEPAQIATWVQFAEKRNYSVTAAAMTLEMAKRDISIQGAGHAPTVDLVTSASHTSNKRYFSTPGGQVSSDNSGSVGVQVRVPLFSGFAITSRVREAIALEEKARNDLIAARRSAAQMAREAYWGLHSGLSQIRAYRAAEVSSLSALDSSKLGYEAGVRTNIDVLNAQQQVFSTHRDLTVSRHDTIINALKLKYAAGILNDQDMWQINQLLEK
ncbi:MAG: TolC family outer membrane protein [Burkholderiaceae bacterium]|jgi:outer membrane protein|nr:TolC family outer membrane protein [Burkholderiaceae bacterium]